MDEGKLGLINIDLYIRFALICRIFISTVPSIFLTMSHVGGFTKRLLRFSLCLNFSVYPIHRFIIDVKCSVLLLTEQLSILTVATIRKCHSKKVDIITDNSPCHHQSVTKH